MAGESTFGCDSSNGSSSDSSSSGSSHSRNHTTTLKPNRLDKETSTAGQESIHAADAAGAGKGKASAEVEFVDILGSEEEEDDVKSMERVAESADKPVSTDHISLYRLKRSKVTEETLDQYVKDRVISPLIRTACRASGSEAVPERQPYEAIVFRDYFVAGLNFPCEPFVEEVLARFKLQIHHLTPNAFARLVVFAMALKMTGCPLNVNTFVRHYDSYFRGKKTTDKRTEVTSHLEFGSYNFVPKNSRHAIVPVYRNKWLLAFLSVITRIAKSMAITLETPVGIL